MTTPSTSYRIIELTKGQVTIVSEQHYEWLNQFKWYAKRQTEGHSFYACRTFVTYRIHENVVMHRFILGLKRGDGRMVDHRNGDTLDNRIENLRLATHGENCRNQKLRIDSKVGLKGVIHTPSNRWHAHIQVDYRRIYLGSFETREEAHEAYCDAARKYHGEFARFA
jgi:HNH endonuclease/AP2 domain